VEAYLSRLFCLNEDENKKFAVRKIFIVLCNILIYTVQHTCSKEGEKDHILSEVPFLSKYIPGENSKPFLGEGYYFWDYNEGYAKVWGKNHYSNSFYVFEADVKIEEGNGDYYLDLAGNRKHLTGFVELLQEFELIHEEGTKGIDLCYIIDYLRNKCPEDVFPFKVIRAVDYHNDEKAGIKIDFNDKESNSGFTILNPRILISYKSKTDIVYQIQPFIKFES
jgi:hypothetical protein